MQSFLEWEDVAGLLPAGVALLDGLREAVERGGHVCLQDDGTRVFQPSETKYGIPGKLLHAGWACAPTPLGGRIALVQPVETDYHRPSVMRRTAFLDAMDWVSEKRMPVRLDTCHRIRILPRVNADGAVIAVTLLNCSIGESPLLRMKVRRPETQRPIWIRPRCGKTALDAVFHADTEEMELRIPPLPGWQMGTLCFME